MSDLTATLAWHPTPECDGLGLDDTAAGAEVTQWADRDCLRVESGYLVRIDLDAPRPDLTGKPAFLLIETFDEHYGCITARYTACGAQEPIATNRSPACGLWGARQWKRHVFRLDDFAWNASAPAVWLGAECETFFSRIVLCTRTPENAPGLDQPASGSIEDVIPPPVPIIWRGGPRMMDAQTRDERLAFLEAMLPLAAALGATSLETPVVWRMVETEQGVFDWSLYDAEVDLIRRHGLQWAPLVVLGPPYATPDWYIADGYSVPFKSLESGRRTLAESIWSPFLTPHLDAVLRALSQQYGGDDTIDTLILGPSGILGEARYPGAHLSWTSGVLGRYHTADTYWCDDEYAAKDFQMYLRGRYPTVKELNRAWGSGYVSFEQVNPTVRSQLSSDRAWVDLVCFYRDAMAGYVDLWLRYARRYFPNTPLYVRASSHTAPQSGADHALQARVCAKYGAGLLLEGLCGDYVTDFIRSRWLASATRLYDAPLLMHGPSNARESAMQGYTLLALDNQAAGMHLYGPDVLAGREVTQSLVAGNHFWQERMTRRPMVAAYYPKIHEALTGEQFHDALMDLRGGLNFDVVCSDMIEDDALEQYAVLILVGGRYMERDTMARILEWVEAGGVLLHSCPMSILTPDGKRGPLSKLKKPRTSLDRLVRLKLPSTLPETYRVRVGSASDAPFVYAGGWYGRQLNTTRESPGRYSRDVSVLRLPVCGGRPTTFCLSYEVPSGLPEYVCRICVEEETCAMIEGSGVGEARWTMTPPGKDVQLLRLTIRSNVWMPSMIYPTSSSQHPLGLCVTSVDVGWPTGPWTQPPDLHLDIDVDVERSLRACTRRVGAGHAVAFPGESGFDFSRWAAAVLASLSSLESTLEDVPGETEAPHGYSVVLERGRLALRNYLALQAEREDS